MEVSPPKATVAIQCSSSVPESPKPKKETPSENEILKKLGETSAEILKKQDQQF